MKFNPDGTHIYVLNELALSVTTFAFDQSKGTMTPIQTVETLSEATKLKELFNSASEIRVHPSGKFVYAANRGHDSISVFRVDAATKKLALVEVEPIRGSWPRHFKLGPDGQMVDRGRPNQQHGNCVFNRPSFRRAYFRTAVSDGSFANLCVVWNRPSVLSQTPIRDMQDNPPRLRTEFVWRSNTGLKATRHINLDCVRR